MRRILSVLLCVALCVSSIPYASAVQTNHSTTEIIETSETSYMEITSFSNSGTLYSRVDTDTPSSFEIKQFSDGELIQIVSGEYGSTELKVIDYKNGKIINSRDMYIGDRVVKGDATANTNQSFTNTSTAVRSTTVLGYITYKPTIDLNTVNRIRVYSTLTKSDTESYTINGKKSDTIAVIAGIILSVVLAPFAGASVAGTIAVAIVGGLGGKVVGDAIGIAFSQPVAVYAYYYTLYGCDYRTNRYTLDYPGVARRVATVGSNFYDDWFYENFTPYNWRDNALAYWFWCDLFGEEYPLVESYT